MTGWSIELDGHLELTVKDSMHELASLGVDRRIGSGLRLAAG